MTIVLFENMRDKVRKSESREVRKKSREIRKSGNPFIAIGLPDFQSFGLIAFVCLIASNSLAQAPAGKQVKNDAFTISVEKYGLAGISKTNDQFATNYVRPGKLLGEVMVRYGVNNQRDSLLAVTNAATVFTENGKTIGSFTPTQRKPSALQLTETFNLAGDSLTWRINLENTGNSPLLVGDLALPFFYNNQGGENSKDIFEKHVIKHHFISGNSSYIFWERPSGTGPYLVMTPLPGTSLEYFDVASYGTDRNAFQAFIHSSYTAAAKKEGNWRQPNTTLQLPSKGKAGYGFKFRWAKDYDGIRNILFEEGLVDVRVVPGMTIPSDMEATIALHCRYTIDAVQAEYAKSTIITPVKSNVPGMRLYKIKFNRLGENIINVSYNNRRFHTTLEFFATEPLDVLYKKRASFIVNSQQHKDPSKWYDGLFSQWDMKNKVLRGPDNTDGFDEWWGYVLSCDDPGLCKAPFLAAKNVFYPDQHEIDAIEYYLEHFVWGKLQRTDKEQPYPYGVYGTPNWDVNRDTAKRRLITRDKNQDKEHIWRSYDYPHIMMLYYHMYQVASMYPGMTHYLDKKQYLIRAKETAKAYFTYPYQILPWYETYKWGCYNELLLIDLAKDLDKEGYTQDAQWLRSEWEKKVKYFIYDDPYPFRSEYAVDATAYESTHALAKYGVENTLQPDSNLWFDKNKNIWYSHPVIKPGDAKDFMERQLQANIACRGWLEPAYYYMGSDFRGNSDKYLLSYMAQMGGWGILDYALNYAKDPNTYLQLGYASYLSAFALMNTGTAESNYGYWYPGKENDGATGWAFEPRQSTTTWIRKSQGRGAWFYDGEIDLGYGGATRTAATVIANDPVFGWIAYGGSLQYNNNTFDIILKDGLRTRLYYRYGRSAMDVTLDRDGFAKDQPVKIAPATGNLRAVIENRSGDAHTTTLTIKGFPAGTYRMITGNKQTAGIEVNGHEQQLAIAMGKNALMIVLLERIK